VVNSISQKKKLYPTEIVAGILANVEKNQIPSTKKELHTAFYHMRAKYPEVLSCFRFDVSGTFPYSPTLEQATSNLATSLLLERNNPTLNVYRITPKLKRHYNKTVKPKASSDELIAISNVADYVTKTI